MNNNFIEKVKNIVKNNFNLSCDIYHQFESRYNFFYNLTNELAKFVNIGNDEKVLDAGCGCGYSMKAIFDNFSQNVYGIDISEGMINLGKKLYPEFNFIVGDIGEIDRYFEIDFFDSILFNLVVFIIPDIKDVFEKSFKILKENGKIGFSYYPEIIDEKGEDLFEIAFNLNKYNKPNKQVISEFDKCLNALGEAGFSNIEIKKYEMRLDIEFLKNFFSIPAQSASLFPKDDFEQRKEKVEKLFNSIKSYENKGKIIWKLAKGEKS